MKRLMKYVKPHMWYIALTVVIKFVGTYAELWIPSIMETMLDDVVETGNVPMIYSYGGLMLLCAAACLVLNIMANRMTAFSSGKVTKAIRHDLFKKLQSLSARQMDELTVPSAESRLTSDTYHVNNMLTRIQRMGIRAPILLVGGTIMLVQMDWMLALVMLALLPIISIVIVLVSKKSLPLYTKQQSVLDDLVLVTQENITGIRVIKALSKTEHEKKRFDKVNTELAEVSQRAGRVTSINGPATMAVMRIGLSLVVLVGALRVNNEVIEAGVIIAALQYFTMIINAMSGITRIFIMWTRGEASAKRVADVLDLPEDMALEPAAEAEQASPHIEFRNVTFSYNGVGKNVDNLNFSLQHGQTLGILGGTGSGKTTILNLLLRLYDVNEGQILIDGKDIRTIPDEELRKKFGIVFQNDFVTEGTIAHNIRFFRDISDQDVQKAADCAQAAFIAEKEGGMEAEVVIRGNNLSGGQKQRLLIARALAANPEILVLDDASSALDYQTDANLRRALRENYRNTTTVLVTQRVSSLQHADLILVLSDGEVIGAGNHEHLLNTCEEYQLIAKTQMGEERGCLLMPGPMHRMRQAETSGDKRKFDNKAKEPMGKTLLRLWRYIGKYRILVVLAVILALTSSLLAIVGPRLSGMAINALNLEGGKVDMPAIYKCVTWMLICYVSSSVLSYVLQVVMLKLSRSVSRQMRHDVFENLTKLPVGFFDKFQPGDIISTLTYDVDTVNQSLSTDLLHILQSSVTVTAALVMMLSIAPKLVLILFVTIPITILLTRYITKKVRPLFRKRSAKLGALNGFVEEMLTGQKTIHAYGQEEAVLERFDEKNGEAVYAYTKAEADGTITGPSVNFINNISLALVCTFGSILFLHKGVKLGDLNSFIQYSRRFTGPINETANIISELQSAFAAAERVFSLIDAAPELADAENAMELTDVKGDVRLENVDFSYVEGQPIIQSLNLHAKPGSLTAIVGPTGAGKTTIINLLMRFYDTQGGCIYVDGHEIRDLTRASLRRAYSMVLQDTWLFHGTIYDNIAYGKPGATMEDVVAAAKAAHIHGYISRLPQGYDTVLTDNGTSISKGQKQLLTIARAMLLDAHMLILDEATSNVDTRTEHKIQQAMRTLMQGKTCFVIAHRLSTIQSADNILVLDGGKVVEQGNHEELMAQKGFYYRLYQSQFDSVS